MWSLEDGRKNIFGGNDSRACAGWRESGHKCLIWFSVFGVQIVTGSLRRTFPCSIVFFFVCYCDGSSLVFQILICVQQIHRIDLHGFIPSFRALETTRMEIYVQRHKVGNCISQGSTFFPELCYVELCLQCSVFLVPFHCDLARRCISIVAMHARCHASMSDKTCPVKNGN